MADQPTSTTPPPDPNNPAVRLRIPASVPPYNSPAGNLNRRSVEKPLSSPLTHGNGGTEDSEGAIEEKKNKKIVVADKAQIENIKKQRKLKLSDLVTRPEPHAASGWPYDLILVRHGQSEGNEAVSRSEKGDLSAYTPEFKKKHSSTYRLTDKGVQQAKVTGQWIKENIGERFDRCYTSEYVRAMETAAYLDLPDAKWYTEIVLRERDKGILDNTSAVDKAERFADEMERRKRDAFFWAPPGGESIANVCVRIDHTLNTLRRECANQRVLIVCHGEVMWAFRVRVERLSQIQFHKLQKSKDPKDKIHNTQVIHYTRIHPETGEIFPDFRFMRASCPWKPQYSSDEWLEFSRPTFSAEELLESVHAVPRYVNNARDPAEGDDSVNY